MSTRIVYMGTPEFAVAPLRSLIAGGYHIAGVVCQPDRPKGRHMKRDPVPVKQLANQQGIDVIQPEKIKDPAFHAQLLSWKPDLIVTAAYGRILPPAVLAIPKRGCLNVHASLLPAYRGAAPIQWSLIRGEKTTGITIMLMDEGMDTGPILAQETLAVPPDMDAGQLSQTLSELGAGLLPAVVDAWLAGTLEPRAQDEDKAFSVPPLTRDMGEIDWTRTDEQIHNQIRGLYPWPGTYTWCSEKRLKIHRARVCRDKEIRDLAEGQEPGTICLCSREAMSVVCGSGVVDLLEIQSESGKRLHCRDCAHNYRMGQKMGGQES